MKQTTRQKHNREIEKNIAVTVKLKQIPEAINARAMPIIRRGVELNKKATYRNLSEILEILLTVF